MLKRGMSSIVATLLIIMITMVAVGIVWVVVRNVIQSGTEEVSLGKFTINLEIKKVSIDIIANTSSVTIKRNPGEGKITGLNFIFDDGQNSQIVKYNSSINELEEKTVTLNLNPLKINLSRIKTVSVAPIFLLDSGKEIMGDIKDEFEITNVNYCFPDCTGRECGLDPNCGQSCGTCNLNHAVSNCNLSAMCEISSCDNGWDNCNGNRLDGCETQLGTISNCGSCDDDCTGIDICSSGQCVTPSIWVPDFTINASLSNIGGASRESPFVFYMDESWFLIIGRYYYTYIGYAWNGAGWTYNSTIINGLTTSITDSTPAAFYKDSSWYLIVGNNGGTFTGYAWNGAGWTSNSTIISGLGNIGSYSAPEVFYKDSSLYLISGRGTGDFAGYAWNGAGWTSNSTIISGLSTVMGVSNPSVFQKDGKLFLISSGSSSLSGFSWEDSSWAPNSTINASLPTMNNPIPAVFQKDGTWYMITGDYNGYLRGFRWTG